MGDFGAQVLASSVALLILIAIMLVVYIIWTQVGLKKKRKYFANLHQEIAPGKECIFCGGMFGKIKAVNDDVVQVQVRSGAVIDVSRYAISEVK
ncbi:MAG: preprotein translocase subunit YajC [Coriobacteriaceae bacterium]|nr:preprotein translocase subunit YajC [Coriobacteriaceae bacterium]